MKLLTTTLGLSALVGGTATLLLPLTMMATLGTSEVALQPVSSCTVDSTGLTVDELDDDQLGNAATIVSVGASLKIPPRGQVIALATALQESGLHNLHHGDRDSLGLFQQRPSQGWGRPDQVTDPRYSAAAFFGGPTSPSRNTGLLEVPGWQQLELWAAAQAVQGSAFPTAYAKWEGLAHDIVAKLAGAEVSCAPLATGPWVLPIVDAYELTSGFGMRIHPISGAVRMHTGLDMAATTGTQVRAISAGTITWAGRDAGYGNLVRIQHDGVESYYAHLSRIDVTSGQSVSTGTVIGAVGTTGHSTGPHLHLEIRFNGQPTDPEPFLREKGLNP